MEKEWFPSLEEYNPGITKEQWIEFVQDKNLFNEKALEVFDETGILEGIEVMEEKDLIRFKCLLEYFVTHLEWCENQDENFSGYEKFIKPIKEKFKSTGKGENGNGIQIQINKWDCYKGRRIGITIYNSHGRGYQQRNCYLHWMETWYNIHANWENNHITSLYLSKEPKVDAKKELEKTIEELGLFTENITDDLKVFFDEFLKWEIGALQMTDYEKKLDEIKNNLLANKNVILTGAPGTGKTFMAKTVAERMGCTENEICFVQFHPSYDYTDFVEGLRPKQVDGSDQIGFERKDGVFKAFCEKALKNLVDSNKTIIQIQKELSWQEKLMIFLDESIEDRRFYALSKNGKIGIENYHEDIIYIQLPDNPIHKSDQIHISKLLKILNSEEEFDRAIDVERFLNGYHSAEYSYLLAIYKAIRDFNFSSFELSSKEIIKQEKKNFVFIIDEINRGEVAKIFGELFYCIDPGYRGEKGRISTQYQNLVTSGEFQKGFFIPENVYIIGTMNDIDRSVESMDFAFRRRFSWIEVKASDAVNMLYPSTNENGESTGLESKELADEAKRRMENLNAEISKIDELNDAYHIGASYFLKLNNYDGSQEKRFESLWIYHIRGILQEYLRGNPNGKLDDLKSAYDKAEELKA